MFGHFFGPLDSEPWTAALEKNLAKRLAINSKEECLYATGASFPSSVFIRERTYTYTLYLFISTKYKLYSIKV